MSLALASSIFFANLINYLLKDKIKSFLYGIEYP